MKEMPMGRRESGLEADGAAVPAEREAPSADFGHRVEAAFGKLEAARRERLRDNAGLLKKGLSELTGKLPELPPAEKEAIRRQAPGEARAQLESELREQFFDKLRQMAGPGTDPGMLATMKDSAIEQAKKAAARAHERWALEIKSGQEQAARRQRHDDLWRQIDLYRQQIAKYPDWEQSSTKGRGASGEIISRAGFQAAGAQVIEREVKKRGPEEIVTQPYLDALQRHADYLRQVAEDMRTRYMTRSASRGGREAVDAAAEAFLAQFENDKRQQGGGRSTMSPR